MSRPADFIQANTKLLAVPLVGEIRLHLAEESMPIWQKTEEELGRMNVPPPYWAFAWAGGQALARYLLDNPGLVEGRSVLDLGAGSGLTAIAAMKAGASKVLAADIDPYAAAAVVLNAQANNVHVDTATADLLDAPAEAFDLILVVISFTSASWPTGYWPLPRRHATAGLWCWPATRAGAIFPGTSFSSSRSTRFPSRATWKIWRSSTRRCGSSPPEHTSRNPE